MDFTNQIGITNEQVYTNRRDINNLMELLGNFKQQLIDIEAQIVPSSGGNTYVTNPMTVTLDGGGFTVYNVDGLTITGTSNLQGVVTVGGNASFSKNVNITGNAVTTGTFTVSGVTSLGDNLLVTGATTLNNTLAVTSATTLSNTLAVTSATTLNNTLAVIGATTLNNTLAVTSATTLNNTLAVTSATTLSNTLAVTGPTTLSGTLHAQAATTCGGSLEVTGATTLNNTLAVTSATTLGNTLAVTSEATFSNNINCSSSKLTVVANQAANALWQDETFHLTGGAKITHNIKVDGTANVTGDTTLSGAVDIQNNTPSTSTDSGALKVAGGVGIGGPLNVGGIQRLYDGTNAGSTSNGALIIDGGVGIKLSLYANIINAVTSIGGPILNITNYAEINQAFIGSAAYSATAPVLHVKNLTVSTSIPVAKFEGKYSASGSVKLAQFEREGGLVSASIDYIDSSTDMQFGTITSHAFSFKTGDTRRLTIDTSGNISMPAASTGQLSVYNLFATNRFGVKAMNTSYDLYNDGTTYLNGDTIIDATLLITAPATSPAPEIRVGSGLRIDDETATGVTTKFCGRLGFNRDPKSGAATAITTAQRFQINGPGNGFDGWDLQNYDSSGTHLGSLRFSGGKFGVLRVSTINAILHIGAPNDDAASAVGNQTNPALQIGNTVNYRLGMYTTNEAAYIENKNGDDGIIFRVKSAGEVIRVISGTHTTTPTGGALAFPNPNGTGLAYIDFDNTNLQLNTQRDPNTGSFADPSKTRVSIQLAGEASNGYINFYTTAANASAPGPTARIDKLGNLHLMGGLDNRIKLSNSGYSGESMSNNTVHVRGDNDTLKLNAAANGHIIFEENGTERLRILSGTGMLEVPGSLYNIGLGANNMANVTGGYNIAIGLDALHNIGSGNENIALGRDAGSAITSGKQNTAVGHESLMNVTGQDGCVAIGFQALQSCEANYNVGIGWNAGEYISTGTNNICIGKESGSNANGPFGQKLTTQSNIIILGDNNIQDIYCVATTITGSDRRDKADITNFTSGLEFVKKMQPVTYRWDRRSWYLPRDENGNLTEDDINKVTPDGSKKENKIELGFIAQDVELLEKEIGFANDRTDRLITNLTENGNNYGIKYPIIVTVLVNAIKDLSTELDAAKARISSLESR